ncbi:MAG: hypothetical protein NZR01_01040 [Bryobacteraceae bacterium]|nr:hypothetical protein [Bryobacteraceae bacterium]
MARRLLLLAALAAPAALLCAQTETQHGFDAGIRFAPRLDLVPHTRIRTQPSGLGLYQARAGPVLEFSPHRNFRWIAGYYYTQQENSRQDFLGGHRYFGGAEARVWSNGAAGADLRALAERFLMAGGRDFARYRIRLRVSGRRAVAPYGSIENFLDAHGWRSTRYAGGARFGNGSRMSFDLGYFFEPRRGELGRVRHMVTTAVHWNFGTKRRGDPDL